MQVSVIIPTYGRPDNLRRAINSVLLQRDVIFEIIVVDDNDPSSEFRTLTESIIDSYHDSRLRYIKHDLNINGAAARNTGVSVSNGEYIAFLDDDDEFIPNKLTEHYGSASTSNALFSYSLYESRVGNSVSRVSKYTKEGDLKFDTLCSVIDFNSSCLLVHKSLFRLVGGFDEKFNRNQDYEFIIRCMKHTSAHCLSKVLVVRHFDSKVNHPNFHNYLLVRNQFFNKFQEEINSLTKLRYIIFSSHFNFDLGIYCLRSRLYLKALGYFMRSLPIFIDVAYLFKRLRLI